MESITSSQARARLHGLLGKIAESRRPVLITGRRSNAVLVAEDDWRAIQETLYLLSIPGMRKSIPDGIKTPVSRCSKKVLW